MVVRNSMVQVHVINQEKCCKVGELRLSVNLGNVPAQKLSVAKITGEDGGFPELSKGLAISQLSLRRPNSRLSARQCTGSGMHCSRIIINNQSDELSKHKLTNLSDIPRTKHLRATDTCLLDNWFCSGYATQPNLDTHLVCHHQLGLQA